MPCDTYVDGTEKKNNFKGIPNIELHKKIIRYILYNISHHLLIERDMADKNNNNNNKLLT